MAINCERGRYAFQPGPSVLHVEGIQFALSGPIPERKEQFDFPIIFKRAPNQKCRRTLVLP